MRYFSPVLDIATIKRPLHTILRAEGSAHVFLRQTSPETIKSQLFVDFDKNYALFFPRLRYVDI